MSAPWDVGHQRHGLVSRGDIIASPLSRSTMCLFCDLYPATHDEWCTRHYPGTARPNEAQDFDPVGIYERFLPTLERLRARFDERDVYR